MIKLVYKKEWGCKSMDYARLKELMANQEFEMTAGERLKAYLAGDEVDCIPYSLMEIEQALAAIYGYTSKQVREDFEVMAKLIRAKKEDYGVDGIGTGLGLRTLGEALGSELEYPEIGIEHVKKYVLMDYGNFNKLVIPDPRENGVLSSLLDDTRKLIDHFPDMELSTWVCGPLSAASAIRPVEHLLRDTRKNPAKLRELFQLCVDSAVRWLEVFREEFGPVSVLIADPVTSTSMLSKKQFDEFSLPYLSDLVRRTTEIMGDKPTMHICGKSKELWLDLKNIGISTFSIDNCEDIGEARDILGDKLFLVGNIPPVDVFRNGSIEDVIDACKECMRKAGDSPKGYMIEAGCDIPIGTPVENLDAFIYAVRKYGKGARIGHMPKGMLDVSNQ